MRCPKCDHPENKVEEIEAGKIRMEWVLACVACPWQCSKRALQAWLDRWRN